MRIRYLKNTEEILSDSPLVIQDPTKHRGLWRDVFEIPGAGQNTSEATSPKLCLEIGCGKGGFVRGMAQLHPHMYLLGMEHLSTVLARAILVSERSHKVPENAEAEAHYRFMREDAKNLSLLFEENELDGIYLNFSDPWPKKRYALRRLTSPAFLPLYEKALKQGGFLRFKTDQQPLFEYSLKSLKEAGWNIVSFTEDLHGDSEEAVWLRKGDVMTEYETKFVELAHPIYCLLANKK